MRKTKAAIAVIALSATLTACASGRPRGPSNALIERALTGAPGQAQPSAIVSAEIAFARAAREKGQWTAFAEFAAPDAVIHGTGGTIPAAPWLATQSNPAEAVQWGVRTVVMSCDGALAVSLGRFQTPEDIVGNYVTVWQRQGDRSYRYTYDVAAPDVPQPPPRAPVEDGDIVVTAFDSIEGLVATCPRSGETVPPPPVARTSPFATASGGTVSADGTLRWRWEHREDGSKFVTADYYYLGEWVTPIKENLASGPEE